MIVSKAPVHGLSNGCAESCDPMRAGSLCMRDRKSTRLNSSHTVISYAVFCLKKKKYEGYWIPLLDIGKLLSRRQSIALGNRYGHPPCSSQARVRLGGHTDGIEVERR